MISFILSSIGIFITGWVAIFVISFIYGVIAETLGF